MEPKPLQPLNSGVVLLVGVKASNFSEEIKSHPRVVMWDSQNEHWLNKDLPSNTRAVFMTRFIGHDAFVNIVKEARKRQITIFNPEGTGMIARQVRELLAINHPPAEVHHYEYKPVTELLVIAEQKETTMSKQPGKLKALIPHIDFSKTNLVNAHMLLEHAVRLNIKTTLGSLAQLVSVHRKRLSPSTVTKTVIMKKPQTQVQTKDVSVQIFDNLIKELTDMRDFIVATVNENNALKERMAHLKKALGE